MHIEYQKHKQIFTKYITACNARTRHTNRFSKILKRKLGKKQKFCRSFTREDDVSSPSINNQTELYYNDEDNGDYRWLKRTSSPTSDYKL